jgi:hypothetical protein
LFLPKNCFIKRKKEYTRAYKVKKEREGENEKDSEGLRKIVRG